MDLFLVAVNAVLRLPGHAFRIWTLRRLCGWSVGEGTVVERRTTVTARGGVALGEGCVVNRGVTLDGRGGLTVGNLVNVSPEALVLTADHDADSPGFEWRARPVSIGARSWIATRAVVLPGSSIGEGAVVAAGAVVSGDVAPFTVVAGVPAQPLRERSRDAQRSLPAYRRWWH
ncbi:MAG: acyltransferase [Actinomycetota bacterium]|nr:acyltransferase [Actinomycetota bacterium]